MNLSKTLFWDIDIKSLDYQKHQNFIVERVLNRGKLSDWLAIKYYYGLETLKAEALEIRFLSDKTLHFCSNYFDTPITKFRCYNTKQSSQRHWNY